MNSLSRPNTNSVLTSIGMILLTGFGTLSPVEGDELTVSTALDLFEKATRAIQTYDVTLTVTRHWAAKTQQVGVTKDGPREAPLLEWRALTDGEETPVETHRWRQVRDSRGRRHVEKLDAATGRAEAFTVFDGEVTRTLNEKARQGYLGPADAQYVQQDEDYVTFYANELGETRLVQLLRERPDTRLLEDPMRRGAIILDSPPQQEGGYAQFGYTVRLDAGHGLLPSQIDVRVREPNGEVVLWRQVIVRKFIPLANGAWAPVEVSIKSFAPSGPIKGSPTQEAVAVVDVARSSWNKPLDQGLFTLAFPRGISILDDLRRVTFVTGNANREANLAELAKHAQKQMPNPIIDVQPEAQRLNWQLILLLLVNALVVLGIVIFVLRRYRRRSYA